MGEIGRAEDLEMLRGSPAIMIAEHMDTSRRRRNEESKAIDCKETVDVGLSL